MYEDSRTPVVRRIIWLAISVLVVAGLVWLLLWFFVWRGSDTTSNKSATQTVTTSQKTGTGSAPDTTTAPSADSTSQPSSTPSTTSTINSTSPSTGVTSSTSTTQPALANTGPGSFAAPIALAVAGGTIYYNVRLRRKLQR